MPTPTTTLPDTPHGVLLPLGVLRARALVENGLSRQQIKQMADEGKLLRIGRGLYQLPDAPITENHGLAQVAARVPSGIVCLTSALQFHGITTASPWCVHLMLPRGARVPKLDYPPLEIVYAAPTTYEAGIEEHVLEGVTVKVTSLPKTIADCFKYRNKIGLALALEALQQALEEQKTTRGEIHRYAKICRVDNIIRPYMEAFSV
jgi:predicted transcriptional regulator of viral defense system